MKDWSIKSENIGKKYALNQEKSKDLRHSIPQMLKRFVSTNEDNKFWALRNIDFEILPGEAVGVIGSNGAGKSTLLKILSRITFPSEGRFEMNGRVSSLLEVGTGFHPELSGRDNIFLNGTILGMKRHEIKRKFDEIVQFSDVSKFIDTPVKHYSSGMKVRLAFSVAAHLEPEILIVDEVLAVGDAQFQKKCLGKMKEVQNNEGRTVLFVSHNMSAVKKLCTRGFLIEGGQLNFDGNVNTAINKYFSSSSAQRKSFDNSYLTKAQIMVSEDGYVIDVDYNTQSAFGTPNLGFVVSDILGNPVFGSNPFLSGEKLKTNYPTKGKISCKINSPSLRTGTYYISLWFGDGQIDYFEAINALSFEVTHSDKNGVADPLQVGAAIPEINWNYY